jgi:hypothetical protein
MYGIANGGQECQKRSMDSTLTLSSLPHARKLSPVLVIIAEVENFQVNGD